MTFKESVQVQGDRQILSVSPWTHRVTLSTVDIHDFSQIDRFDEDTNNLHPIMCSMWPMSSNVTIWWHHLKTWPWREDTLSFSQLKNTLWIHCISICHHLLWCIKEYILLSLLEMVVCIIDHLVSCHILVTTKTEMLHYYLIIALMKRVMGHW